MWSRIVATMHCHASHALRALSPPRPHTQMHDHASSRLSDGYLVAFVWQPPALRTALAIGSGVVDACIGAAGIVRVGLQVRRWPIAIPIEL